MRKCNKCETIQPESEFFNRITPTCNSCRTNNLSGSISTRTCYVCGKTKPDSDFFAKTNRCHPCREASYKRLGQTAQAARAQPMKKKYKRPDMPVKKPDGTHMPICTTVGCKRRVSDARKSICGHCAKKASGSIAYGYGEDWAGMYGSMD